jgi:hypothetical protein
MLLLHRLRQRKVPAEACARGSEVFVILRRSVSRQPNEDQQIKFHRFAELAGEKLLAG